MDKRQDPSISFLQKTPNLMTFKDLKWKMENNIPCKWKQKESFIAILISDKTEGIT